MPDPIECGLKIEGISDQLIEKTFSKTLKMFEGWGYQLKEKARFLKEGKIEITGRGKDKRCAFCEYFRQAVVEHFKENNTKGEIELISCPFNPDKRINYTPEVQEARKKLLETFARLKKEKENAP